MALSYKTDQDHDERLNPATRAKSLSDQENQAFDNIADNFDKTADDSQENKNIADAKNREESGAGWVNNVSGSAQNTKSKFSLKGMVTKKKGIAGGIIALLLGGGALGGFILGPSGMIIDLMERITLKNDSSSMAAERRVVKVLSNMTNPDNDTFCANSTKHLKCRTGRISNKALYQLNKKGVTAAGYDGTTKSGYPSKNPASYDFDLGDGKKQNVLAKDLPSFLTDSKNRKLASKVLGIQGAFNMRAKMWTGKHITGNFYKKFNIKLNGGLADGTGKKVTSANERLKAATDKLKSKIPGNEKLSGAADAIREKVKATAEKSKRGGAVYMSAVTGCIATKAPSFIAAGVIAVQLAQIMPIISDLILSPGSKLKASGIDPDNSATPEDMDGIGTLLTNKTARDGDGKMTSALDSPYLLAALGVNSSKLTPSSNFSPGFGVLSNPTMKSMIEVQNDAEPTCNKIMSPAAMWTAFTIDSAATVAASVTLVGGIVKVIGGFIATEIAVKLATEIVGAAASTAIENIAENDNIPNAQGEQLGDVVGISAMAFFSGGGMARNLPTLTESQLVAYEDVKQETIAFNQSLEAASLSPFDPSSRYTVVGSMLASFRTAALSSGSYGTPSSLLGGLLRLPATALSPNASASNQTINDCSYAKDFGLATDNPATTPAINAAGLPCTGLLSDMDSATAYELLEGEGWLDGQEAMKLGDDATIDDLISGGAILPNTPLSSFIETCSDASTGDYIFSQGGCITQNVGTTGGLGDSVCYDTVVDGSTQQQCETDSNMGVTEVDLVKNPRAMEAMSVWLLDYQVTQSINGEDDGPLAEDESDQSGSTDGTEESVDVGPIGASTNWASPIPKGVAYTSTGSYGESRGSYRHEGSDFAYRNADFVSICDGIVTRVDNKGDIRTPGNVAMSNHLTVDCGGGIYARYHHYYYREVKPGIKVGARVTAGQPLAAVGNQGNTQGATGIHLHFEIRTRDNVGFQYTKYPIDFLRSKGVNI